MRWDWLALSLLLLWPTIAGARHIAWMEPYRDAEGTSCCGRSDCRPADITVLNHRRGEVLLDGVPLTLPPGSIHRIPPEAHEPDAVGYWCWKGSPDRITSETTRCVFFKTPLW